MTAALLSRHLIQFINNKEQCWVAVKLIKSFASLQRYI